MPTKIFQATIDDIPRIIPCAQEYMDIIPDVELDTSHYVKSWENFYKSGIGAIFLVENDSGEAVGGIGGVHFPELLTGRDTAVELFWYVKPEYRRQGVGLYRAFEKWAKDMGCSHIAMIYLPCSMPDKLKQFYESQGFALKELHYEKRLTP